MPTVYIGLTFAYTIMVLTDLIGNTLVILVVMRHRSMQTPMNYLLVNLAVADMMVAVFIALQFNLVLSIPIPKEHFGRFFASLSQEGH